MASRSGQYGEKTARQLLMALGPFTPEQLVPLLSELHQFGGSGDATAVEFWTLYLGGGSAEARLLLDWALSVGGRASSIAVTSDALAVLRLMAKIWDVSVAYPTFHLAVVHHVSTLAHDVKYLSEAKPTLEWLLDRANRNASPAAPALREALAVNAPPDGGLWKLAIIPIAYLAVWALIVVTYPKSKFVQTLFWTDRLRQILGLGMIDAALPRVPMLGQFLGRRLIAPFTEALRSDADLPDFAARDYYHGIQVRVGNDPAVLPLSNELVTRYAALIVTGESGSGKRRFCVTWPMARRRRSCSFARGTASTASSTRSPRS